MIIAFPTTISIPPIPKKNTTREPPHIAGLTILGTIATRETTT
jgi:hypothetical protein